MEPREPSQGDLPASAIPHSACDAEVLERYLVAPEAALQDEDVRELVARRPELVRVGRALQAGWQTEMVEVRQRGEQGLERLMRARRTVGGEDGAVLRGRMLPAKQTFGKQALRRWVGYGATAAIIAGCVISGLAYNGLSNKSPNSVTTIYATANGQRAVVTFSDGSRVTLAPATTARIISSPGADNAITVQLEGEAIFDVSSQGARAFKVDADDVSVRVLGTTFVVRAYKNDKSVQVGVASGKVSVLGTTLAVRDLATISGDKQVRVTKADVFSITSWSRGVLHFNDVPLADAIPDLSRWFDVDIKLSNPALGKETLKGTIPSGSRADLARLLSTVVGVRSELSGRVLTLHFQ